MPYMEHPQVATPPDETAIWRYMDLPKFLLMLEQKNLYFSLLSEFEDKWEAVLDRELTRGIANGGDHVLAPIQNYHVVSSAVATCGKAQVFSNG
jgi:hypothetical protein